MADAAERLARLHDVLRDRICLLDYPPGTRLSEEALAAEFGISRTPLRRVLGRLADEGLLQIAHGVGTLVTDADIAGMAPTYALRMELAQLVGTLQPAAVTEQVRARMGGFVRRGADLRAAPDARDFARLNMDYFRFGLSLTENGALREMSGRLYYQTTRIWLKSIARLDLRDEIDIFCRELAETQLALDNGDTQAAALIRRAHISLSFTRLSRQGA